MKQILQFQRLAVFLLLILLTACSPATEAPPIVQPSGATLEDTPVPAVPTKASANSTVNITAPTPTTQKEDSGSAPITQSKGILANSNQATISSASINNVTPDDVLTEIAFDGTGGGPTCGKTGYTQPEYEPTVLHPDVTLMEAPLLLSCGWKENEKVKVTVRYPDGREFFHMYTAEQSDGITYLYSTYQITIDDPIGTYTFIAEGSSGRIETSINVQQPSGPMLFPIYKDPFDFVDYAASHSHPRLLLYGFTPNELITLVMYKDHPNGNRHVIGSQQVTTGPDGHLVIKNDQADANFWVAIGHQSGVINQAAYNIFGEVLGPHPILTQCSTVKPTRVSGAAQIRIAHTDGKNLRVRKSPGFDQEILTSVPEGTILKVYQSPRCADGTWWWMVEGKNIFGWVAEADPNTYLIEPAP